MNYKKILITGGAGFVGSSISIRLKQEFPKIKIYAFDNLKRRGSEFNIPRLKHNGVNFIHGDTRIMEEIDIPSDLIIDCAADAAPTAGIISRSDNLLHTNLNGSINCFEVAKKYKADVIFFSSSRIYPVDKINKIKFMYHDNQVKISKQSQINGVSARGINENFPLNGEVRSLYGASKLASELLLKEYIDGFGINGVIYRPSSIAGPGQMSYRFQGFVTQVLANYYFKKPMEFQGFGGNGNQIRDAIHIDDLCDLVIKHVTNIKDHNKQIYNVGGGIKNSFSLSRLAEISAEITGNKIKITQNKKERKWDIKFYISDHSLVTSTSNWYPKRNLIDILKETIVWLDKNKEIANYFNQGLME